jgi:hypothetical protein
MIVLGYRCDEENIDTGGRKRDRADEPRRTAADNDDFGSFAVVRVVHVSDPVTRRICN